MYVLAIYVFRYFLLQKQIAQINKHIDNFIQQLRDFSQTSDVKGGPLPKLRLVEDVTFLQPAKCGRRVGSRTHAPCNEHCTAHSTTTCSNNNDKCNSSNNRQHNQCSRVRTVNSDHTFPNSLYVSWCRL
jgi:hypothetical protein